MYVFEVIPIIKGLPENYLTYFFNKKISPGSIVEIKIRNKKAIGIILKVEELKEKKLDIKSSKFKIKKIEKILYENFFEKDLFESINNISSLLGVKESDILENYLPNFVFNNINIIKNDIKENNKTKKYKEEIIIDNIENRIKKYIKKINNNFLKNKSTVIFSPTINELKYIEKILENNKIKNILSFHSDEKEAILQKNIKKIEDAKSVLILSTPSLLPFILKEKINLVTIILEKENSFNYFTHTKKKRIDSRKIIKNLCKDLNLNLILGGEIISLSTYKSIKNKINYIKKESQEKEKKINIVDISKNKILEEAFEKIKYNPIYFSYELAKKIENLKDKNKKIFLYAKKKGLYTETICSDCNTIFKCEKCDKPYTLFQKIDKNNNSIRIYICNNCKDTIELKKSENLICRNCSSWRMQTLGVATEGIEDNLKKIGFKTFLIDSDNTKTKKSITETIASWQKEKDTSILIGTDLALNFLNKDIICDFGAIISLDTLFSIPEITIDEKIFNICQEMREKINTKEKIIIQTRLPNQDIWEYIERNYVIEFLTNELDTREKFNLPPFTNILKWQIDKKNIKIKDNIEKILNQIFKEENIEKVNIIYKIDKKTSNQIATMIIKKEIWQKEKDGKLIPTQFAKKITSLLSDFKLEINPPNVY